MEALSTDDVVPQRVLGPLLQAFMVQTSINIANFLAFLPFMTRALPIVTKMFPREPTAVQALVLLPTPLIFFLYKVTSTKEQWDFSGFLIKSNVEKQSEPENKDGDETEDDDEDGDGDEGEDQDADAGEEEDAVSGEEDDEEEPETNADGGNKEDEERRIVCLTQTEDEYDEDDDDENDEDEDADEDANKEEEDEEIPQPPAKKRK